MGWAEAAVAMAGMAVQGLGMWLGGGGDSRTPYTRGKKGTVMGPAEAIFTGDMIRSMLTDARRRGFASTAPRVKFEVPQIHTRSADLILPFSGQKYKAGGTDLGLFQQTQSKYAGLGAGQERTHVAPFNQALYPGGGNGDGDGDGTGESTKHHEDPPIINGDSGDNGDDNVTTTGDNGNGEDTRDTEIYAAPARQAQGAALPPNIVNVAAQAARAPQPQGAAGYNAGGGSMGDEFRRVAALRDSVARRGKLDRSGAGAPAAAPAAAPVGPAQMV